MTEYEKKVYESIPSPHSKWWVPASWFSNLVSQARTEGRIRDDFSMNKILEEMHSFRTGCGNLYSYDWISVPLVYTQVVTLCVYTFFLASLMGSQYLDPELAYPGRSADFYIPYFTFLQFFFYMGWLKVAEQLINPFGEDDDDFDMTWVVDRNLQVSYLSVDEMYMEYPDIEKDMYWDEVDPVIPHTTASISTRNDPFMGSMANLSIPDVAMSTVVPLETINEYDLNAGVHKTVSEHSLFQHFKDNHHKEEDAAHHNPTNQHLSALLHDRQNDHVDVSMIDVEDPGNRTTPSDMIKSSSAINKPIELDQDHLSKMPFSVDQNHSPTVTVDRLHPPKASCRRNYPADQQARSPTKYQFHHLQHRDLTDPRQSLLLRRLEKHPSANDFRVGKWLKNKFGLNPLPPHLQAVRSDSINSMPVWLDQEDSRALQEVSITRNVASPCQPSPNLRSSQNRVKSKSTLKDLASRSPDTTTVADHSQNGREPKETIVNMPDTGDVGQHDDDVSATSNSSYDLSDDSNNTVSSIKQLLGDNSKDMV